MTVDIKLDIADAQGRNFLGWAPVKGQVWLTGGAAPGPVQIALRNGGQAGGGRLLFDSHWSDAGQGQLNLALPADGSRVDFWVAGEFQHPSTTYGDAIIEVADNTGAVLSKEPVMVRVRKDAVTLTAPERDRFLVALGKLNNAGKGPFQSFRDSHNVSALDESHGFPAFPPWHRAYLLDLERELQSIDPTVALPYWRFDKPAPALFGADFFGMPPANPASGDVIQFPNGHPLEFWKTDVSDPIERRPLYNIQSVPPQSLQGRPFVISQAATLALGKQYSQFRNYEGAPHGSAHVSFQGPIQSPPTAPKDPLFFLLHANVDRLWAFWQWLNHRFDAASQSSYSTAGNVRQPNDIGHKLNDTMWPWNQSVTPPRPTSPPPRGAFPPSPFQRPGGQPIVKDMIDYQGVHGGGSLGFDYDDVPFELPPGGQP